MFPSWEINNNKKKWNEPSIDFVFYAENINTFLCVELKNQIKGQKNLLSTFCQISHRTMQFIELYSITKIEKAMAICYNNAITERGGAEKTINTIIFKNNPSVKGFIMAHKFPVSSIRDIENWNSNSFNEIISNINNYKSNREFERFYRIGKNRFQKLRSDISIVEIS